MKVYARLPSDHWRNQFLIMAVSFLKHHPKHELHVLSDVELPQIERLIVHDFYADIETGASRLCVLSPTLFFRGSLDEVFTKTKGIEGACFMSKQKGTKQDLVIYTYHERKEIGGEDARFNFSIPIHNDLGGITQAKERMAQAVVINTRLFKPWDSQFDSGRMLSFGWSQYLEAMEDAKQHLDPEFINQVKENAVHHNFMDRYSKNIGVFNELLETINRL